jgi:hypothetical protein
VPLTLMAGRPAPAAPGQGLIDPTSIGGGVNPFMDGYPHRFSTDFEQTLLGGHLTRRGVGCPRVPLGT